ncbi:TRAP transporter fused permease subunit [Sulfitobacter sp. M368]|uniref:TRAP transporter permease n=1 Tax=Sulfitobacter sp. M368 TaxID=2867021 RepID=UPI0021A6A371|nr:TRAP transporter fused permease subunit [Sulfitobacter sp. M368]
MRHLVTLGRAVALFMAVYHLWIGYFGAPNALIMRSVHLGLVLTITFLMIDWRGKKDTPGIAEVALVLLSIGVAAYPIVEIDYIYNRFYLIDPIKPADWVFGIAANLLVIEAARRLMGWPLAITASIFLGYAMFFTNIAPGELIEQTYLTTEGIFGIPLAVSATFITLFVLFGALIEKMGIGQFFVDFALALAGRTSGGAAKVALITSSLFGTVSGNGVANVMTTGVFTIPMMKKAGFRPNVAGAVEAVASTGGQILPPVMGASAFLMAEFIGTSYAQICLYALIPALLYYATVFAAIHFEARATGLEGLPADQTPKLGKVLIENGHLSIPLLVIILSLVSGYSAQFSALAGIASVVPVALLRKSTRSNVTVRNVLDALVEGARNAVLIATACATAGIVVGVINITGIGLDFSQAVLRLADENLYLALILASMAGIVVGMGIPTAPAYIVQVALFVPTLTELGIPVPAAHMFAFYFAILSGLTPPVAITVYAANAISGAGLWQGCAASMKLAGTAYVMPFMFALSPAILTLGTGSEIAQTALTALLGGVLLAAGFHGWLLSSLAALLRPVAVVAGLCLLGPSGLLDLAGLALAAPVLFLSARARRNPEETGA